MRRRGPDQRRKKNPLTGYEKYQQSEASFYRNGHWTAFIQYIFISSFLMQTPVRIRCELKGSEFNLPLRNCYI